LKYSNASPKVKTMKEGVGVRSLTYNTLGVKGHVGAPGWGLRRMKASQIFTWTCIAQTISWLVHG